MPDEPFAAKDSNTIWSWCAAHYREFAQAPGQLIEARFEEFARTSKDQDQVRAIDRLLVSLSGEYERLAAARDTEFLLTLCEKHCNDVLLEKLEEEVRGLRGRGEVAEAVARVQAFAARRVDLRSPPYVNVLTDVAAQRAALETRQRVLVRYPGAAGLFFGEELAEDSFVALMAISKGGKSWALLDVAWRGLLQGRRVAYFQVGDMTRNQVLRRFLRRAAYRPFRAGLVELPTGLLAPADYKGLAVREARTVNFAAPMSLAVASRAFERVAVKTRGELRLSYHPTLTIDVPALKAILGRWDEAGWAAQVVVIDYAGNLAPVDPRRATHEQVAQTWALLRQLSEERKCLVVTAQQTNKEGFSAWVLTRRHFRDSLMILAHVTAFLGINATDEEKSQGIVRYNFVVRREESFSESLCLYGASCLELANPLVCTALPGRGL